MAPTDDVERIEFIVAEGNALAVAVFDVHPFIDGNHADDLAGGGMRAVDGVVVQAGA